MSKPKTIDAYIESLDGWQKQAVASLRDLVLDAAPQAKESFKWSQPVFEENGPFAYIKAFKNHVNFGFWRGVDLKDPYSLLEGSGEKMRHIKITGLKDIQEHAFKDFVHAAVQLNLTKGDPTKGS